MRRFLISLLLASVLTPAAGLAQDSGFGRGGRPHGERADDSSDDPPQRPERAQRSEPAERPSPVERPVHVDRVQGPNGADHAARIERVERPARVEPNVEHVQSTDQVQRIRRIERRNSQEVGSPLQTREQKREGFGGLHDRIVRNGDRNDSSHHWSGDWRNDHRYDWRNHRSHYGSLYRLGRYNDPYHYGYHRFSIGFNLWPSYYGSNFWLNDPWQYRLPPAYGPYRWVRYYDDALLVNIYDGQVVDVIHNFFW